MKRIITTILLHLLFWIGIWFLFYYFFSYNSPDRGYVIWFASLLLPLTMAITYFSVYFLLPRYLFTRQYGRLALFSFYTLVASSYFIVLIIYGCMFIYQGFSASNIPPMIKNFFFILILVYLVVGIVSFITILNRSFDTDRRNRELQNKMLSAQLQLKEQELHYLKRQIHPHFLFNTLNTIYGLALKQSMHTPDVILKLSNLLDYILYQVDKPGVSLEEEILHIREYVDLERIRFADTLQVEMEEGAIGKDVEVAPMLLIPLVENAFKHGSILDGTLRVRMEISRNGNSLRFSIGNTCRQEENGNGGKQGIGLENFRKRLDLNYKDNYSLENTLHDNWYRAELLIHDLHRQDDET